MAKMIGYSTIDFFEKKKCLQEGAFGKKMIAELH